MSKAENSGTPRAAAVFFDRVAAAILQQHAHALPDLREAVIILPNYHVAVPLAQHLARAAGLPALLLPQMVTINDWAESVPLASGHHPRHLPRHHSVSGPARARVVSRRRSVGHCQ